VLTKEGPMDCLSVRVETAHGAAEDAGRNASAALAHDIKTYIGVSAKIDVLPEGGIERSVGKAKRVVDQRPR
jgi:phenylacetate-CoA ligase